MLVKFKKWLKVFNEIKGLVFKKYEVRILLMSRLYFYYGGILKIGG